MEKLTYEYSKKWLIENLEEEAGKNIFISFEFPKKDVIVLRIPFFDDKKNYISFGILFSDRFIDDEKAIFVGQMEFMLVADVGSEGKMLECHVGNEEWSDFMKVFKKMGKLVNDGFKTSLGTLCTGDEKEACIYCKYANKEAFEDLIEKMNKYWFASEGEENETVCCD